ncbi:MAG: type II toxin-antitoxin system VapC family toxin [Deltaproteobacteria bacterium]|nr:type II toxin-antitoxin system VapC family toxin [Deltaproteobacteria bacterium]
MRLLIDTQVFIWAVLDSKYLSPEARQIMIDAADIFVSSASIWEIAIKTKIGRLDGEPKEFVSAIERSGFKELPVYARHTAGVYELPLHHNDPFDRLLIAQAMSESLHLLTADKILEQYSNIVIHVKKINP